VREYDLVCRYGGDEFLILAEADEEDVAARISGMIGREFDVFNYTEIKKYHLSFSIGYAYWEPAEGRSLSELICEADAKMYQDKGIYRAEEG